MRVFRYITNIVSLLFKVYFGVFFYVSLALLYPLFYLFLSHRRGFKAAFHLKRFWAFLLQLGYFSIVVVKKESALPAGPFIICSNHSSYLDIIFMYRAVPRYFLFMGKNELLKWPLFRLFFQRQDIAVDRGSASGAALAFKRAREALKRGESIAIFPEGTIPKDQPKLHRFKDGAFKLAIECQVPIVPLTFRTNWKLLRDIDQWLGPARPGLAHIVVHKAIATEGMQAEDLVSLRQLVFDTIDKTLHHGSH